MKLEFLQQIFENYWNVEFHFHPVEAKLFCVDKQTWQL